MNQPQLLGYIKDPALLSSAPVKELEHLVAEFPYCQVTHLLYTKALFEQKSLNYHKQLKHAAAHIRDRSILYWLINDQAAGTEVADVANQLLSVVPDAVLPGTGSDNKTADVKHEIPVMPDATQDLISRLNRLSGLILPDYHEAEEKLKNIEQAYRDRVNAIVHEQLNARLQRQALHLIEKQIAEDLKAQTKQIIAAEQLPADNEYIIEIPEAEENEKTPDVTPSKSELIDRFITEAPSMPRPKKEFFSPANMAHKSTMDSDELVTETLAEIHLQQGNMQKAIKIYERLCLLIPEKSAYFAARIEKIKAENNIL
jgi:tetratricopeptide (TPR) repeat protein